MVLAGTSTPWRRRDAPQALGADVLPIVHTLEVNLADGSISVLDGCAEIFSGGRNPQNPTSASQQLVVLHLRSGVEDFDTAKRFGSFVARDHLSGFWLARIPL